MTGIKIFSEGKRCGSIKSKKIRAISCPLPGGKNNMLKN